MKFISIFLFSIGFSVLTFSQCVENQLLYDFTINRDHWQPNNLYAFGKSGNSIDNDGSSIFAKMEIINPDGRYKRSGVNTDFNGQVQDWSLYPSIKFGIKFRNVAVAIANDNVDRSPARPENLRKVFVELVELSGERFAYRIEFVDFNWQSYSIDFTDFFKRGGNNPGDGLLNTSAIKKLSFHVQSNSPESFTEIFRVDAIELICDPDIIVDPNQKLLCTVAEAFTIPNGAPKYSDVCLTSRRRRPDAANRYPVSTESAVEGFHPTRLDWTFLTDQDFINDVVVNYSLKFSSVLNSKLPDEINGNINSMGRCLDPANNPIEWEWMRFNEYIENIGSPNDPAYRDIYLEHARLAYNGIGRNNLVAIHMDEPGFAYRVAVDRDGQGNLRYNGCFGPTDLSKAQSLGYDILNSQSQNVAFQSLSQDNFYDEMHAAIIEESGLQNLGFSYNNGGAGFSGGGFDFTIARSSQKFDYAMGELAYDDLNPATLFNASQEARAFGKIQVYSPARLINQGPSDYENDSTLYIYQTSNPERDLNRKAIATAYGSGAIHLVPWDTWFYKSTRHFGKASEYADLFAMIRAVPYYFDNYEEAAKFSPNNSLGENRYDGDFPIIVNSGNNNVWAFARAIPDDKRSPVVVHLVNWGNANTSATVSLINKYISANGEYTAKIIKPKAYSANDHQIARIDAEQRLNGLRGDYQYPAFENLIQSEPVTINQNNAISTIDLNGLGVWTMLILIPVENCEEELVELNQPIINNNQLVDYSIISNGRVSDGNRVSYRAGQDLEFSSGFQVLAGADFQAAIANCDEEIVEPGNLLNLNFNNNLIGSDGELPGIATGLVFQSGSVDQAIAINNVDQLSYPSVDNINYIEGTIEALVKPSWPGNDNNDHALFSWGLAGGMLIEKDRNNYLKIIVNKYGFDDAGNEISVAHNISNWEQNTWYHVAFTWSSSAVELFINGEMMNSLPSNFSLPSVVADDLFIGSDNQSKVWNGLIDEFYISDYAKTEVEIQQVYADFQLN